MKKDISKQKFGKMVIGAVVVILTFAMFSSINISVDENITSAGLVKLISDGADKVSLEESSQRTGMHILTPSSLPYLTNLKDVYVNKEGTGTILLYSNPNLKAINKIGAVNIGSAEIIVTMTKKQNNPIYAVKNNDGHMMEGIVTYANGTQIVKHIQQSPTKEYVDVIINGVDGIGFDTSLDYSGQIYPPSVSWWNNGILYQVQSHLSIEELVIMAESLK